MAAMDPNFRISGTICAPLTPFTADGELNLSAMPAYVQYLDTHDIDGVFRRCVSALAIHSRYTNQSGPSPEGDPRSMPQSPRMIPRVDEILKIVSQHIGKPFALHHIDRTLHRRVIPDRCLKAYAQSLCVSEVLKLKSVIVHVGTGNLKDTIELAQHAGKIGVTAIACMSPNYNKPKNEEILVKYMKQVAAAAPNTPFYYYDINFMTGVNLNTSLFLELAADQIPTLRGAKISSRELPQLTDCTFVAGGRFQVMIGTDEQLLTGLSLGVDVPVLNGFLGGVFRRLKTAFDANDMQTARKEQILARKLVLERGKYGGGPPMVKSIMRCLGVDLGHVRLPLVDLTADQERKLRQDLVDIGFIEK